MVEKRLEFVRLTEVPLRLVVDLLDEPRNRRHMPMSSEVTAESAAAWVSAKDGQWAAHGYGPEAVLVAGAFAGWCGFQREENGADFALVLAPAYWGHGAAVMRLALDRGFDQLGLDVVLIALPFSRSPARAVGRFGFEPAGEVSYDGFRFRQYRLTLGRWHRVRDHTP